MTPETRTAVPAEEAEPPIGVELEPVSKLHRVVNATKGFFGDLVGIVKNGDVDAMARDLRFF